jgi:DNA-directed RNA polymerase subunit beta
MAYSYTEKKRIRKDFGTLPQVMDVPYLLAIQLDSYRKFTQQGVPLEERLDYGLHAAFKSVFPIVSYSGNAALEYVDYRLGTPVFDVASVSCAARPMPLRCACWVRLVIYDKESAGWQQGRSRTSRSRKSTWANSAHDRERHLHHQRHRARHRLPAAPLAGRVLRPRQGQDALLGQAAVLARVIPYRGSWLDFEFDPKDLCSSVSTAAASCRRPFCCARSATTPRKSSPCSSTSTPSRSGEGEYELELVPERLRGDVAAFDIKVGEEVIVEQGRRITARHIRELEKAGVSDLPVPAEYLHGRTLAKNVVDEKPVKCWPSANGDHRGGAGAAGRERRQGASRPCSPTISTTVRSSPTPAPGRRRATSSRRWSRSTA